VVGEGVVLRKRPWAIPATSGHVYR
jgi:hypothetical protein